MTISELLSASMAKHKQGRPQGRGMSRPANWRELMREACDLRKQALELDPERADQAWRDEEKHTATGRNTHTVLTAFYRDLFGDA